MNINLLIHASQTIGKYGGNRSPKKPSNKPMWIAVVFYIITQTVSVILLYNSPNLNLFIGWWIAISVPFGLSFFAYAFAIIFE